MTENNQQKADKNREIYKEEAYALLTELESSLLELEEHAENHELIDNVFRALHTIKGSGAMVGFDNIASFTHEVETAFDMVRDGDLSVTKELIDLTLLAKDCILSMLAESDEQSSACESTGLEIISSLKKLLGQEKEADTDTLQSKRTHLSIEQHKETIYRIQFHPSSNIFTREMDPIAFLNELKELGHCDILAHSKSIPKLENMDPETCYTYWDLVLTTNEGIDTIEDIFNCIVNDCELNIDVITSIDDLDKNFENKRIGDIIVDRGYLTREDIELVADQKKRIGETLIDAGLVDAHEIESALMEQKHIKNAQLMHQKKNPTPGLRVSSKKLDNLVDLVGELVTVQARLTQHTASDNDPELHSIAEEVELLTNELHEKTMDIRMVPVGTMFSKFKRLVRDLSDELGKEINLTMEGAETELDKTVIEMLNDPLVHLIRNCIDHGIEPPENRESIGKTRNGTIHLSARYSGTHVLIEIKDDGAGLDTDKLRAKTVEKGLVDAGIELPEKELFNYILLPGFSTSDEISNISGRGVGMDVVKRNIDALRGTIDISSQKGSGTTITLKLPLTLAIIDGLLVKVGPEFFVIPLSLVEECVELTEEDSKISHGREITNVRGEIIPFINLRNEFQINGSKPEIEHIVITDIDNSRVGFVVDEVIGEHQTVIKTLGRFYKDIDGILGATILGNGSIALILNLPKLFKKIEKREIALNNN